MRADSSLCAGTVNSGCLCGDTCVLVFTSATNYLVVDLVGIAPRIYISVNARTLAFELALQC